MTRTDRQRKADDLLIEAIEVVIAAYDMDGVLADFIVIAATNHFDSDGDLDSRIKILMRDGGMAGYRAAGLIEVARSAVIAE